jgi:acetolactate synthase regulatory subunit
MKWLIALETDSDPIAACRLMNIFRRKGVKIATLTMTAQPAGYSMMVLVETPETDAEHIFNFLRSTAGVHHVDTYRHEPSAKASFLFMDGAEDASSVTRIIETLPGAKLLFASHGKFLVEVPAAAGQTHASFAEAGFLPFARVRTTREALQAAPAVC